MKKIQLFSLLALVLFSPSAFAIKGGISKIFDGKFGLCTELKHAGNRAYLPDGLSAKNELSALSVTFILQNLKCEAQGEAVDWAAHSRPGEPAEDRDLYNRPMTIKVSNREAVLVRGSDASILSVIPLEEVAQQPLDFGFTLEQLLSSSEMAALDAGQSLEARATFFVRSQVTVQTHTGENVQLGLRSGGAYAIFLILKKAPTGQIQVLSMRLK